MGIGYELFKANSRLSHYFILFLISIYFCARQMDIRKKAVGKGQIDLKTEDLKLGCWPQIISRRTTENLWSQADQG